MSGRIRFSVPKLPALMAAYVELDAGVAAAGANDLLASALRQGLRREQAAAYMGKAAKAAREVAEKLDAATSEEGPQYMPPAPVALSVALAYLHERAAGYHGRATTVLQAQIECLDASQQRAVITGILEAASAVAASWERSVGDQVWELAC